MREEFLATSAAIRQPVIAPAVVVNGEHAIARVGEIVARWGSSALVIGGSKSYPEARAPLEASLQASGVAFEVTTYGADCCEPELDRLRALTRARPVGAVVGVGGGKALDTAKLVAHRSGLPVVTVPTSAATCAAWTALSNVYSPEGTWLYGVALPTNPEAVVVDYALIARAPCRLLSAGLADTLAKWVESRASVSPTESDALTLAAVEMARFLYERLRLIGEQAYEQAQRGIVGPELRAVVDANVQLAGTVGGLGGARCRSVAAHAVCNALTTMPGHRASWHGEKVAFGIVVQRLLQGVSEDQLRELVRFFQAIGIPTTLLGLGVPDDAAAIASIAEATVRPESSAHLLPGGVDVARVIRAIRAADALGRTPSSTPPLS